MDYQKILEELNNASLFELYRLNNAIWKQLEDPDKNYQIKRQLTPNKEITYFNADENRLVEANVIDVKRTRAIIRDKKEGRSWSIPFYQINIDNTDVDIKPQDQTLNRNSVKVGDQVCFTDKKGQEVFGIVTKLNPKTAGIQVNYTQWRVAYSLLSPVMEGQIDNSQYLEGEVVKPKIKS